MRKIVLAVIALTVICVAERACGQSNTPVALTIQNSTGFAIIHVFVSPTYSDSWGDDLLGDYIMYNGQHITVHLSRYRTYFFDIRLVDSDGDTYTVRGFNIRQNPILIATILILDVRF